MRGPRVATLVSLVLIVLTWAAPMRAQSPTGRIGGTVRDPNGAPMAGAAVSVTNMGGMTRVARTTTAGTYEMTDLMPGAYTVSVDVQGFRKVVSKNQNVAAGGTTTVDFTLELRLLEDVTVTAMKREETVFSTPVSVAAPTEEDLRELGVNDIEGVANNVADFTVQNLGPGQSTVAIRGVSSGQIARDQPGVKEQVGAYLDESVISMSLFTPDMDLFDMNRVEVLRGPQGTLFGSGSVGGTVRYISNQPQLGETAAFGEVGGAAIDGGGTGGNFKAGFNTPLGEKAALRMAAYYNRLAGWTEAVQPDLSIKPNVNAGDRLGVRLALEIAPIENLTITPRFAYQKVAMDGWNRIDEYNILANPFTTSRTPVTLNNQIFTQIDEPFTDKFYLGDIKINWKGSSWELTSITSFTNRDVRVIRDATALTGSVTGGTIGEPEAVYTIDSPLDDRTHASGLSQELRADGTLIDNRLHWLLGGFYSDGDRHYNQFLNVKGFEDIACNVPGGICIPTQTQFAAKDELYFSDIKYKDREYGIFGEATFEFVHAFSLTAGLRYYNYKVDKDLTFDGLFAPIFPDPTVELGKTTKADGVAPRFIASFKATDDIIINAQASKGFRLGGVNDPILLPLCSDPDKVTFGNIPTWADEKAWNYELGAKMRFMGGRLSVNPTAFYIDVKNLQVVVTAGTCSSRLVFNVPKARSVGGELEVTFAPTNNFDFAFSGSYNNAEVRESLDGPEAAIHATGIREGNRLPSVPEFQMSLSATYQQPIVPTWWGYVTGNYQHVGSRYTQLVDQEPGTGIIPLQNVPGSLDFTIGGPLTQDTFTFNPLLPAYDLVNFRVGVRHGVWDVAFYVNNITNEQALLSLDRERGFRAREGFIVNQPRTFGISSRFDF